MSSPALNPERFMEGYMEKIRKEGCIDGNIDFTMHI